MNLDPRTIIIMTIVGTLLMSLSLFGISFGHLSQIRGIRKWAGATMMQSIAWIVISVFRGIIPEVISAVLGNALLLLSIVFYFKIIAEFKNIKIKIVWAYLLVGLEAVILTYFVLVSPNVAARFAVISGSLAIIMFASCYLLLFEGRSSSFSHKLTGSMFAICSLFLSIRCFNSLIWDTAPGQQIFGYHPLQNMAYLTFYITSIMLTFGFVLMCNDKYISERKLVEDALTESKEQINTIIINAPDGVIVIDEESFITEWNPMSEIIFGWKREEVIGKPLYETIIPQRFRKAHIEGVKHFFKTGEGALLNKQVELTGIRKNNSEIDLGISISPTLIKGKYFYISFVTDISERKHKEFEKQEADEKIRILSKAIEQSPVTTLITDVDGNIEFVNPKFTETSGYTLDEVIGQNPRIFKTEYKLGPGYKELWDTILSGKSWHGIFQNKKKTGELYWESAVISPVKDKDGTITHFLAVKEDITERKKSEEELVKSNERFLKLFDNNPVGMVITNLETLRFQFVNESFLAIFGYTKEEIIDKTSVELNIIEPESREKIISIFETQGDLKDVEANARKKNGEIFWSLTSVQEIILDDKKFALSSFQDITERKKTEIILKNKTALLNEAQQIAQTGSWDWDLVENKVTRSDEHYRIYGLSRPEFEPNYEIFQKYTHPDDREYADTIFKQAFKDCKPFDFFHRIIRPDGIVRILHAKGNVLTDSKGKAIRLVGTRQDVTEIKLAEQELIQNIKDRQAAEAIIVEKSVELERSNRDLEEFAYIVSHDLKAPLRAIASLSSFLKEDYGDKLGENGEELLNLMVGRADRLNNLIEGILKYSKISRGQQKTEKVNLNTIVKEVKELIAPPENMEIIIENILPSVMCDPFKATQVFQNLIGNAIKYMDKPNGIIKVGSLSDDDFWKFYVADNGPGIGEKYFEKIFQIFQTLTPRDKQESTGIGLSIVKKIIESYGGRVWLESELGKGSTFYFTMPKN